LTHHQILRVVEPFTRRGRRVDLGASDRIARRLVFQAQTRLGCGPNGEDLREHLVLEEPAPGSYRLTRTLSLPSALDATLVTRGEDPRALLERIEAVAAQRQFRAGLGYEIAESFECGAADAPDALVFASGRASVRGLLLEVFGASVNGARAAVHLSVAGGGALALPEDILAVLGWAWSPLGQDRASWTGSLKVSGPEPVRSRRAEARLEQAALHLARVLAAPPAVYHERHRAARWGVSLRRALPLLGCIGLIAAAAAVPSLHLAERSGLRMLIFNAPPLLMMLFFCLREIPRIELPRIPRRLDVAVWLADAEISPRCA
jgi:hypothetical protein